MIDLKELRLGNIVLWDNFVMPPNFICARPTVLDVFPQGEIFNDPKLSPIQAIPLDEDWLLKFGFEMYDYYPNDEMSDNPDFIYLSYKMELEGKRYYYSITNTEFHYWEFCQKVEWAEEMLIASCQYVHQLQNLYFALTQTELQFNK